MQGTVTLDTLGNGALAELFDVELERLLRNIEDVNTRATATRKICIELSFQPNEDRDVVETFVKCVAKLEPIKRFKTQVYMGRRDGRLVAVEHDTRQRDLFDDPAARAAAAGPRAV